MALLCASYLINVYCHDVSLDDIDQIKKIAKLNQSNEIIEEIIQLIVGGRPFNQIYYKELNKVFSFMACYFAKNKIEPNWLITEETIAKVLSSIKRETCYLDIKDSKIQILKEEVEGSIPFKKNKIQFLVKNLVDTLDVKRDELSEERRKTVLDEMRGLERKISKHVKKIMAIEETIKPYRERINLLHHMAEVHHGANNLCKRSNEAISFGYPLERSEITKLISKSLTDISPRKVKKKTDESKNLDEDKTEEADQEADQEDVQEDVQEAAQEADQEDVQEAAQEADQEDVQEAAQEADIIEMDSDTELNLDSDEEDDLNTI
jgi:hypothetical protein